MPRMASLGHLVNSARLIRPPATSLAAGATGLQTFARRLSSVSSTFGSTRERASKDSNASRALGLRGSRDPDSRKDGSQPDGGGASGSQTGRSGGLGNISAAMKFYLDKRSKHEDFIRTQDEEFHRGKRHLANIMGLDPETITQQEIDESIRYLFPSGLTEPSARPVMRPPEDIFPRQKEAQFDIEGRPNHFLFYTVWPLFYDIMHNIKRYQGELNDFEDRMITKGVHHPPPEAKIHLGSSRWLTHKEIKADLLENVRESLYNEMIAALERLCDHPYSGRVAEFIMKYRKALLSVTAEMEVPPLRHDEAGRPYMAAQGRRTTTEVHATVRGQGSGRVTVNEYPYDFLYFDHVHMREIIMSPLVFTGLLNKVDIELEVSRWKTRNCDPNDPTPAKAAKAGAARYAIAMALRSFVDKETVERMRIAGLLTEDVRYRERKKPGQEGARRKFTWKKR